MFRQKSPVVSTSRPLLKSALKDEHVQLVKYRPLKRSPTYYRKKANPNESLWQRVQESSYSPGLPPLKKMYVSGKKPNLSNLSNFEQGRMRVYERVNDHENDMKMEYISTPKRMFIVEDEEDDIPKPKPRSQTFYSPRRTFEVEDIEDIPKPKPRSQTFYSPTRSFEVEDVEDIPKPKPRSQTFYSPTRSFEVEDVEDIPKPKPRSQTFYSPTRSFEVEDVLSFGKRKKSVGTKKSKKSRKSRKSRKNVKRETRNKKSVRRGAKKSVRNKKR